MEDISRFHIEYLTQISRGGQTPFPVKDRGCLRPFLFGFLQGTAHRTGKELREVRYLMSSLGQDRCDVVEGGLAFIASTGVHCARGVLGSKLVSLS